MEWISCKERLPEKPEFVLGFGPHNAQYVCQYTNGHELEYWDEDYEGPYDEIEDKNGTLYLKAGWYELEEQAQSSFDEYWIKREITHWMPLPEPPKP